MPKPIQRTGQNNPFTWEISEDGKWWHYVSSGGLEVLRLTPEDFGKDELSEYPRPPALDGKRIIRVANSRDGALNYKPAGESGLLLVIDPRDVQADEYFVNPHSSGYRIVLGSTVARVGRLEATGTGNKATGG